MGFVLKRTGMDLWWSEQESNWVKSPADARIWRAREGAQTSVSRISRFIWANFFPQNFAIEERPELEPHADEPHLFVTPKAFTFTTMEEAKLILGELRDHQLKIESSLHQRLPKSSPQQRREYLARRHDLRYALSCIIRKAKYVHDWISVHNLVGSGQTAKKTRKFGTNILVEAQKAVDLFISCKERGLSDKDARDVVLDQVAFMVCQVYGTPRVDPGAPEAQEQPLEEIP